MSTTVAATRTGRIPFDLVVAAPADIAGSSIPIPQGGRIAYAAVPDEQTWVRSRYAVSVLQQLAVGAEDQEARDISALGVAWWAQETGWGVNEWNWNPGNVKCSTEGVQCMPLVDHTSGANVMFESYGDLATGIDDYWLTVQSDSGDAWDQFTTGDVRALLTLDASAYSAGSIGESDWRSIYQRVVNDLGQFPGGPIPDPGEPLGIPRIVPAGTGAWSPSSASNASSGIGLAGVAAAVGLGWLGWRLVGGR